LQEAVLAARVSRDIDIFADSAAAVAAAWDGDREVLTGAGCEVAVVRERPGYVEARVTKGNEAILVEWAQDSAFRFFPLVSHPDFGLTLHPFDLATNKVLALVGRLETRDWIDVVESADRIQPLGYLAWAASGKDPGFTPHAILDQAARTGRYTQDEIDALAFDGPPPTAHDLAGRWLAHLRAAREACALLPPGCAGQAVLTPAGTLFTGDASDLRRALDRQALLFHPGRLRGAFPRLCSE
jgi:hypothetical protein